MIRAARPEDAAAVVALRALVCPYLVRGVAGTRQAIATAPRSRLALVADVGGEVPMDVLDVRALHAAHAAASADEPGDVPITPMSYDDWRAEIWDNPDMERSASVAAVVDGEPVALAELLRDGDRVWSDMTATLPEHRGRGLARLAKLAALHRARDAGATAAYTSNDEANAPMLAVNSRLGYRPVATQWSCLRELR